MWRHYVCCLFKIYQTCSFFMEFLISPLLALASPSFSLCFPCMMSAKSGDSRSDTVAHYLVKVLFKWGSCSKRILICRGSQLINQIWQQNEYSYENIHLSFFFFLNLHSGLHTVPCFLYFGYMILRGMLLSLKSFLMNTVTTTLYNY